MICKYTRKSLIEAMGLILLLFSFGWECIENYHNRLFDDRWRYDTSVIIDAICSSEIDEAFHDEDRSNGHKTLFGVDYDHSFNQYNSHNYTTTYNHKSNGITDNAAYLRIVLYVIGSVLVIVSKLEKKK